MELLLIYVGRLGRFGTIDGQVKEDYTEMLHTAVPRIVISKQRGKGEEKKGRVTEVKQFGCIYIWAKVISVAKKVGCFRESRRKFLKRRFGVYNKPDWPNGEILVQRIDFFFHLLNVLSKPELNWLADVFFSSFADHSFCPAHYIHLFYQFHDKVLILMNLHSGKPFKFYLQMTHTSYFRKKTIVLKEALYVRNHFD